MRNGRIGMIDNTTIYKSRNLYSVTDGGTSETAWYCIFGHPIAVSFAEQLTKVETIRETGTFGTTVRGLDVYGYDVTKTDSMGVLYAGVG